MPQLGGTNRSELTCHALMELLSPTQAACHSWVSVLLCLQGGSVAHIMRYRYPDGLQEAVIATIMKEVGRQDRLHWCCADSDRGMD